MNTKLRSGVYQVAGTDYAIMNDSRRCWYVAKVVDGDASIDDDRYFIQGSRNDAIQYAKELHENVK